MSRVISVGTAKIPFEYNQDEAKEFAYNLFSRNSNDISRMITVFDNAMIEKRHFCFPKKWFNKNYSFVERSEHFLKNGYDLSIQAMDQCLKNADASYDDFDHIIFVTSTGMAAPTIDAHIINELKLNPHIKRTPIWGLGCVAGAAGLSRALEYTKAYPKSGVLLVAVEICSLAFQRDDYSKSNVVAIALFSDGAAATLVTGRGHRLYNQSRINLIDSYTTTYYESLDVMGWEIIETGFKAIFSKDIPHIVKNRVKENIDEFIEKHGLSVSDIQHYILHPGGAKVLDEYENSIGLQNGSIHYSRKVLKEHGNMSSPTVLYVLNEFIEDNKYTHGEHGIISALGPGFSSELILFQIQ